MNYYQIAPTTPHNNSTVKDSKDIQGFQSHLIMTPFTTNQSYA